MINLSISIVNHNNKEYLIKCLESLYSHAPHTSFEVIVVDNGSSDGSVEAIKHSYPLVKVIENSDNKGFVRANNQGIKASKGQYVLSLNNDTIIRNGTLSGLVQFMEEHPDVGACGPKVLNREGSIQYQCRRSFPTISSSLFYFLKLHKVFPRSDFFGKYLMANQDFDTVCDVDSVSGCCLMVRREVINNIGILDENYIMYGDDLDWCYRIKQNGWKVCYIPDLQIVHFGGQSSRNLPWKCIILFYRAMIIFYRKYYAPKHFFIVNYLVYIGIWLKASATLCTNIFRKEKVIGSKKP